MACDKKRINIIGVVYVFDESDSNCIHDYVRAHEDNFKGDYCSELKFMREQFDWHDEKNRVLFFERLRTLIGHLGLERPLPNLGAILRPGEIEWLLAYNVLKPEQLGEHDYRYSVIDFVAKTGYKDVPEAVDSYGRPSSRRTTVVHQMFQSRYYHPDKSVSKLFEIYDRYDVNYRDVIGYTHFHVACLAGCADVVRKFLELGRVDPNELVPRSGDSPLYAALEHGYQDVAKLLLEAGADPNFVHCKHGATPLHIIISMEKQKTSIDFLEMFFAICRAKGHGVDIDALDAKGLAPLHYALISGHARATELLVDNGADPNSSGPRGSTPLHLASWSNRHHSVEALLEACEKRRRGVDVDAVDAKGRTPLHLAVCRGRKKVASGLLKWGADPNSQYNELGETALHVVCADYLEDDMEDVLYDILESGRCRINAVDSLGKTPLHVALAGGRQNIVHALLVHGADPNQPDSDGSTPLHMVCQKRLEDGLTGMLFEYCERRYLPVQVDAQDGHGKTPLHWAVYLGHQNSVHELLVNGADPNLADHQGSTPLHLLCQRPNVDDFAQLFFEWCVAQGQVPRLDVHDELGNTPLHYAVADSCQKHLTRLLLELGADPNLVNNEGSMPLHNICKREQYYDDCLARLFIYVNYQILRQLQIDARDNLGRTPLELAVANHLPHVVQVLLSHGADLSSFVFPTEAYIAKFDRSLGLRYNLTTIKSLRAIDHLARWKNYTLDVSDGLRIMGLFAEHGLLEESDMLERGLDESEDFANEATAIMINSDLSLHDLIRLPRGRAARAFTYEDYCAFVNSKGWINFPMIYRAACDTFLCQSMARRFFQRWTAEYFRLLFHSWLPILCCDLIIENLDLTDLWSICQAANRS
ncbi:unnamed protein product [Trichogramma brassicae]|uniref:Uncharacterized protein n=1 Tax=Trichogramma brassicae TaxID=86971 RepID=A0A6H5IHW9_9HYME|nr:unnamed protein product [Trichogramma brassicae]